jgi:hypothetical protein
MSTDFRLDIPSSVFTMVDIKYNHTMNNKGLLKADLKGRVIWMRPSFHAVSHYASILSPEFSEPKPHSGTLRIVAYKFRRWWANRWKHRIVYREGLIKSFITQVYSHIIKPKSITKL